MVVPSAQSVTSVALCPPSICSFHSFHPNPRSAPVNFAKDEKRAISLDVFMDADRFSMIVNKKHRSVVNNVLLPWLSEDDEENFWKCFGNNDEVVPPKTSETPARLIKKDISDKDEKKNQMVTLKLITPSSISIRNYPIHPSKTARIPAPLPKDQLEPSANASSSLPLTIDTSIPPPSFLTPPTSGPASPSLTAEKPSFAFNVGVVNAPTAGVQVAKKHLLENEDAFEMYVDESKPKKIKVFSPEEIKKQSSLVDEWKRKIQESL
ncbi:hypothetical protein GCK72_003293 [Caenorhabditis remanei]|uniref:Uncharacterized protein n=1 Tax=Caenorhabditis remanei TaxID=31234 RepID=A0A6A5HXZ4_CAERE|nr:hypothetical protein GCK72_003293 [Caenorhabditis remanei]KAF1771467.1 hypothetical protein GCK72_003293 [Caenorhabditis remanei]